MTIAGARAALAEGRWDAALELARQATADDVAAEAERQDAIAEASWWLSRLDDCIEARAAAYEAYSAAGDDVAAGQCAVWLWEHHMIKAKPSIGSAWLRRARRALDGHPGTSAHGAMLLREAEVIHGTGDLEASLTRARTALELGRALRDRDLEAEALQTIGRLLIDAGDPAEGLGHLDEAMLSAAEGRLGPYSTGKVYCSMISACEQLGDLRRAAEWTDATLRWSESEHPLAMWPGICRVHHAALLQQRGEWAQAQEEALRACEELDGFHVLNAAAGYLEVGDIRRRLGDLDGAEAAFAKAEALCGGRSAGLALLRLAQRRIDAAATIITGLLSEQTWNRLARARLLPAQVQISIAAGDLEAASAAADELEETATAHEGSALAAAALTARGRVQLAAGECDRACATLQQALQVWQALDVPYEVATVRLLLGQSCRNRGDEAGARESLAIAAELFDRLGAALDARQTRDLTGGSALPAGLTAREAEVLALVAAGRTNREIATDLHLSERTVARHLSNIFTKVGVTSRTGATAFAFQHGLAEPT